MPELHELPPDLPVPEDDGATGHLPGRLMPPLTLPSTTGQAVALDHLGAGRAVLYLYPLTGRPGAELPKGWDQIPGARGCTAEACAFRDHHDELRQVGVEHVFGVSSQSTGYQQELAQRVHLPFPLLSDTALRLATALDLPTFTAGGMTLFKRLSLILRGGRIEHVFYPVFPPNDHARQVLSWLRANAIPS